MVSFIKKNWPTVPTQVLVISVLKSDKMKFKHFSSLVTATSSTCANGTQLTFETRVKMQLTTSGMVQQQDLMALNSYSCDGW